MHLLLKLVAAAIAILLEPAFVDLKFALVAYYLRQPSWPAAWVGLSGLLLAMAFVNAIGVMEGAKSLAAIFALIGQIPPGAARVADKIPEEVLAAEYGYSHQAFRWGPFTQDAGKMTILYDESGTVCDYQCGFNIFGNSYLLTATGLPLSAMPTMQKYLTLHEIGHGSLMGGVTWIRARWAVASGLLACLFGATVSEIGGLGIVSLTFTGFVLLIFSRPVVIESAAEEFAEIYAIMRIALTDRAAATRLVRFLLKRVAVYGPATQYDRLISKSRIATLARLDDFLHSEQSIEGANLNPIRSWPHYFAALLVAAWVFFSPTQHAAAPSLIIAIFVGLIVLAALTRNRAMRRMHFFDLSISKRLKQDGNS